MATTGMTIPRRAGSRRALGAALVAALLAGPVTACMLEGDDVTLQRVAVGYAYPEALYVLGAVSSARLGGKLDWTLGIDATASPEQLRLVMLRINSALFKLRGRLASATPSVSAPALSIVLLEPMLWTRFATENGKLGMEVHRQGPANGDVVLVTEEPVIAAIVNGTLSFGEARSLGLVRLYGRGQDVATARAWLEADDSPARIAHHAVDDERRAR